jgi:hypothetical protein
VAGCITFDAESSASPPPSGQAATSEPSLVPVVNPAPTPVITVAPGATPSFDIGTILNAAADRVGERP